MDSITDVLRQRAAGAVEDLQSAQAIAGYLEASYVAACAYALVRTGAVDQFKVPIVPSTAAGVAGVDADILVRMVRFMEGHGFFFRYDDGRYELTSLGRLLCRDSPFSQRMRFTDGWDGIGGLSHTLRTGESAFAHVFGKDFWAWLAEHPDEDEAFTASMVHDATVRNLLCAPLIAVEPGDTIADLGGGAGELLGTVLEANPECRGILFDRPQALGKVIPHLRSAPLADRCSIVAGNLFASPPSADIYLLARVLHDWPDADALRILSLVRRAARPGARLYVLELAFPDQNGRHVAKASDMGMMSLFGKARERTEAEYRDLLATAGWSVNSVNVRTLTVVLQAVAS